MVGYARSGGDMGWRGFTREELRDIFNLDPDCPRDRPAIAARQVSSARRLDQGRADLLPIRHLDLLDGTPSCSWPWREAEVRELERARALAASGGRAGWTSTTYAGARSPRAADGRAIVCRTAA
jgi:hypothetical protein